MAKGFEKHRERMGTLSLFGKDLARRSRSCCELCEASGAKLSIFEVPPVEQEPCFEDCIFICDSCRDQIERPKSMIAGHWRCLNNTIWSEVPAVQVMALRMLKRLAAQGEHWAEELLEQAYPSEDVGNWVDLAE